MGAGSGSGADSSDSGTETGGEPAEGGAMERGRRYRGRGSCGEREKAEGDEEMRNRRFLNWTRRF